jgi:uncharacterized membrane protein YdjX (TVP38/TMEM64 family)
MRWATLMRLGRLGPAAAATAFLPPIGLLILLGTMNRSAPWLQSHGALGVVLFVAAFSVFGGFALLPTYAPSVLGGWAFGVVTGLGATLAGFVGAAAIGFALARHLSGDRLLQVLDEYPRGQALHRALLAGSWRRTLLVVTLLRVPPNGPFAMTNLLLAATGVGWGPYLLGSLLGLTPRVAAAVIVGASLSQLDLRHLERGGSAYLSIGLSLVVVVALGWLANRALIECVGASGSSGSSGAE